MTAPNGGRSAFDRDASCAAREWTQDSRVIAPEVLLQGYRLGVFPMAMEDGSIEWFSPNPRGILPLDDGFHVPHALTRVLRKGTFEVRINASFEHVMRRCAERDETWINEEIIRSYTRLHTLGYAHSVETWRDGKIAGGLYGSWWIGVLLSVGMLILISASSMQILSQSGDEVMERQVRWGILMVAALGLAVYLNA